jgi:hypothetical protein
MLAPKLASTRLAKLTASLVELSPEEFEKVLENPYKYASDNHELSQTCKSHAFVPWSCRLMSMNIGMTFATADAIALSYGIARDDPRRIVGAVEATFYHFGPYCGTSFCVILNCLSMIHSCY